MKQPPKQRNTGKQIVLSMCPWLTMFKCVSCSTMLLLICSGKARVKGKRAGKLRKNWNILTSSRWKLERENTQSGLPAQCSCYVETLFNYSYYRFCLLRQAQCVARLNKVLSSLTAHRWDFCYMWLIHTIVIYFHGMYRDITSQVPKA